MKTLVPCLDPLIFSSPYSYNNTQCFQIKLRIRQPRFKCLSYGFLVMTTKLQSDTLCIFTRPWTHLLEEHTSDFTLFHSHIYPTPPPLFIQACFNYTPSHQLSSKNQRTSYFLTSSSIFSTTSYLKISQYQSVG